MLALLGYVLLEFDYHYICEHFLGTTLDYVMLALLLELY